LTNNISEKDKKDWENFLSKNEKLPNKDIKINKKSSFKTRSIDLHGYTLEEANKSIESFIIKSFQENINKLIVVTGKGIHSQNEKDPYVSKDLSILKYSVPEFISNNKNLMKIIYEMKDAKIEDGGSGAFYIFLKKKYDKNTK
jgi:DNA-nicking Smr family endonuclease